MKVDLAQLKKCGWHLSPEALEEMDANEGGDITRRLLQMDLRNIGSGWIPEGLRKNKSGKVEAYGILQIMRIRNIAAPKINEESKTAPCFLRISATDGKESVTLLDMHHHPKLSIDTPPGAKILLKNALNMWEGHIIIRKENAEVLGGSVEKLVEAWKLKRNFSATTGPQLRRMADGSGPPPFLPFGSNKAPPPSRQTHNFRAMDTVREGGGRAAGADGDAEEEAAREFEEHRKAVIEEARQQGGKEARSKLQTFAQQKVKLPPGRGVDQMERRGDIERMIAMGFKPREASAALRKASGDVQKAIDSLLSDQAKGISTGEPHGGRRGRKGRDPLDSDDDDYGPSNVRQAPPSGPATLLDFVTSSKKKTEKEGAGAEAAKAADNAPVAGQMVMAQWRDGRTYRATVQEVFKPDGVVGVFYLDYGEYDVIPIGHVTPIANAKASSEAQTPRDSQSNRRQMFDDHPQESNHRAQKFDNRPRNKDRPPPQHHQRQQPYGNRPQDQHRPPQRDGGQQFGDNRSQGHQRQHQQYQQPRMQAHDSYQSQHHNQPPPPHRYNQFPPHHQQHPGAQAFSDNNWSNEGQGRAFYRQGPPQHFDHRPPPRQPPRGYSQGDYFEGYPLMQGRPQSVEDAMGPSPGFSHRNMQFVRGGQGRPFSARR